MISPSCAEIFMKIDEYPILIDLSQQFLWIVEPLKGTEEDIAKIINKICRIALLRLHQEFSQNDTLVKLTHQKEESPIFKFSDTDIPKTTCKKEIETDYSRFTIKYFR